LSPIIPVIMSGGAGARLWPLSREAFPKPFVPLPDGETLIRKSYARALALPDVRRVVTVTNRELMFLTGDEYERVAGDAVPHGMILEPFGRDTAAAVALASLYVAEAEDPEALMLVMPADHLIPNVAAFAVAVEQAAELGREGCIVVFGIRPTHPETGFGYIEASGSRVVRFVEKPALETAREYVAGGRHFWNAGMFCFRARTMLDAMRRHCPDVLDGCRAAYEASRQSVSDRRVAVEIDKAAFEKVRPISIDYAVMEKAEDAGFVPCAFQWSDIGSWNALAELVPADASGNRFQGDVLAHDAAGSFVRSEDRVVALVGVRDLLVVDTPDALLVADRHRAQDVKAIYNRLKQAGSQTATLHRTAHRPWGSYTVLEEGERFKIKRIEVKPGGRLSLQSHRHRSEHWVVVRGVARVVNGDRDYLLNPDQSTYIPCGNRHRLENPGTEPLIIIEVQSGGYLGEDDIVRYDDVYGRAGETS
jgi:mannose-1-phosphate guanylyltransferase/mannose-6-phosphate isomerase